MIPTETSRNLYWGDRINSLGGCDEVLYYRRVGAFAIRDAEDKGWRSRYEWPNFQTSAGQPSEVLWHQSHAAARFGRCDDAGGAVVFFGDPGREF